MHAETRNTTSDRLSGRFHRTVHRWASRVRAPDSSDPPDRWVVAALLVVTTVVRFPFRAEFLVNWDAVNFALGIGEFDLATHQPHPPGYLGFVAIGRVATWLTGDANGAMTLLSVASGAVATALVYLLARRFVAWKPAVLAAGLFTTAPLVWYYSVVALSYMTTGAVVLALVWAGVVAVQERSHRHLLAASLLLALVGALRPTDQVLLLPMWVAVAWAFPWRLRLRAAVVMGVASLAWVLPLVWLAGGPGAYLAQSSALASLAGNRTWVLGGNLGGMAQNVGLVVAGLVLGLFGGLGAILLARAHGIRALADVARPVRRLLLASIVPAFTIYLLVHTGQLGYLLLVLPAFYVGVACSLPGLVEAIRTGHPVSWAWRGARRLGRRAGWSAVLVVAMLAVNVAASLLLPRMGLRAVAMAQAPSESAAQGSVEPSPEAEPASQQGPAAILERTRQYDVETNDRHWEALVELVEEYDPATTALVVQATSGGSFRHLSYYAEDHDVYGVARDRDQAVGYLFRARERATTYSVEQFERSRSRLVLPSTIRTLLLPDASVSDLFEEDATTEVTEVETATGARVVVVRFSRPSALLFDNSEDEPDEARIGIVPVETAFTDPIGSQ